MARRAAGGHLITAGSGPPCAAIVVLEAGTTRGDANPRMTLAGGMFQGKVGLPRAPARRSGGVVRRLAAPDRWGGVWPSGSEPWWRAWGAAL
jgi:hypothetical protein